MMLAMSLQNQLGREVLKGVSRSFYLSLRLLPKGFREPVSLAYLLARLSDTIADAGRLEQEERVILLSRYEGLLEGTAESGLSPETAFEDWGVSPKESLLLQRSTEVLDWYHQLEDPEQAFIRKVVKVIISGQQWDLTRFAQEGVTSLESREELLEYTWKVAGCVGEFWTQMGFLQKSFSSMDEKELMKKGVRYGKGLQLVNIIRDAPEDLQMGRCYFPVKEVTPAALLTGRQEWIDLAREYLEEGVQYAKSLTQKRVALASVLPARIGLETLDLIEKTNWEEWGGGVKIPRKRVRKILFREILGL